MKCSCMQMTSWNMGIKLLMHLKMVFFLSEHLKTSDVAAYDHVLEDVKNFIQKIELMTEKINLNLFQDFLELPSPADNAKMLINIKNADENKEMVADVKDRISDLKGRIKKMIETEKKKKKMLMRY